MKKNDKTTKDVVIVRRPHQMPVKVFSYDNMSDAIKSWRDSFTYTVYKNVEDFAKSIGWSDLSEDGAIEDMENMKNALKEAGLDENAPFAEFMIGYGESFLKNPEDFNEMDAFSETVADDMSSAGIFEAEDGETYEKFAERIFKYTRGHNAPSLEQIYQSIGIDE